jgi:protein associated with RNAse G/E
VKFTVSGVYSSAISKILVDKGYEPTRLSNTIVQRLGGMGGGEDEPDIVIRDMSRWQGVVLIGDAAKSLANDVLQEVGDAAMLYLPHVYGAVYKASVIERVRNGVIVDLEGRKGLLKTHRYDAEAELVQVTGYARSVSKLLVTDSIKIRSGGAEANRWGRNAFESELPPGWRWKRRASDEENTDVAGKANDLEDMLESPEVPEGRCLLQGKDYVELVFGYEVKPVLDAWRRKLVPTINGHHYLKSLGPEYSALVDFAERVQPLLPEKLDDILAETIAKGVYPRNSEEIRIFHMKPNGTDIERSPAYVLHSDNKVVVAKRSIRSAGKYDGLEVDKRPGDRAISEFRVDEWYYATNYFRRDGSPIGRYVNICTPPEISKSFIRYIDLYVDVVEVNGNVRIIDKDQLDEALENGHITQKMYDKSLKTAEEVAESLTKAAEAETMNEHPT